MVNPRRIRALNLPQPGPGPVAYWMSRDQRVFDNWALIYAQELALKAGQPLLVVFCLTPSFLGATWRQYGFMLQGLKQVEQRLRDLEIPFFLLKGAPGKEIPSWVRARGLGALVCDFSPLRLVRQWKEEVASQIGVPLFEVDAHNLVPCWVASAKAEYGAYTLRPKLKRLWPEFWEDYPGMAGHPFPWPGPRPEIDWEEVRAGLNLDRSVPEVSWLSPGEESARRQLAHFLEHKLAAYGEARNDPTRDGQSHLSPYLHFGQLAPPRVALALKAEPPSSSRDAFLEELLVRRELADNFCFFQRDYEAFAGFPRWAQETLNRHRQDRREYLYTLEQLEQGRTHDDLWNAAQLEMVHRGKMHGYLRMYWGKKILEWTPSPEEALKMAIYLNDRYELDGRDPSGYAGIAWSLGGVHDRPWFERPVFGKIRYMSFKGAAAKFDVAAYIRKVRGLSLP